MSASRSASSSRIEPGVELLDLDVEVADSAEHLADPAELLARFQRGFRQHLGEQRQRCPEPAGRDAHVVQLLDVVSEPRAGLLREHRREVPAQDGQGDGPARHLRDRSRSRRIVPGGEGRRSEDRSPASNLLRPAGCSAHASRSSSNERLERTAARPRGTSISTRRRRAGDPPPGGWIAVSSSAISPGGRPSALRKKVRRRVRTSNNGSSGFLPATARTRAPTGPLGAQERRQRRRLRGVRSPRAGCAIPGTSASRRRGP